MKTNRLPRRNILFIAYHFPPYGGPGVQRSAKFAKYLPDFGYRPLVLTAAQGEIDCPLDTTLLAEQRDTAIFACRGYERLVERLPRGVNLHRVLSFFLRPDRNVLAWLPRARQTALKIARKYPIHGIYTSLCPYSNALLGQRLRKLLGAPWIVDYRDPWTDNTGLIWPTKLHYRFEVRQERRALEAADAVVVVAPTMKELLARRYPQWKSKIHVIHNGFDQEDMNGFAHRGLASWEERTRAGRLQIGFAGAMLDYDANPGGAQFGLLDKLWVCLLSYRLTVPDLTTRSPLYLLRAVRALLDQRPELEDAIALSFAGRFGSRNLQLVRQLKLENVVSVKGYLPHQQALRLLVESDVLFLPMQTEENGRRSYNVSAKVFEYLATGKPILAPVPQGDLCDLIRRAGAGWCVNPHDVGAIKSLLEKLIQKKTTGTLSTTPDRQFIRQFERRELTRHLAALFDSLQS